MLRAQGRAMIFNPDGPYIEQETMTCAHCQKILFIGPGQGPRDVGDVCQRCIGVVCPECAERKICEPWMGGQEN